MVKKDVIIIGAGLAGIAAAYEAHKEGASVMLVDRGAIGLGTNSALADGYFAAPTSCYTVDNYISDTIKAGKGLNNVTLVNVLAHEAPIAIKFLRKLGFDFKETEHHFIYESPNPVHPCLPMVRRVVVELEKLNNVDFFPGFYVTEILRDEDKAFGVRGFDGTGKVITILAPSIILATGGGGAIYPKTANHSKALGQGYYLAAKVGLKLWDMEFVQFYPLVIDEPFLPAILAPYFEETSLVNVNGEDVIKKYGFSNIDDAAMLQRDKLSAAIFRENLSGQVFMDYRKVPLSLLDVFPFNLMKNNKFDFRSKPVSISPASHFFMGGVRINEYGETSLTGLLACGEAVCGLHGANRRGGNALTECVTFGRIAGKNAALHSLSSKHSFLHNDISSNDLSINNRSKGLKGRELLANIKGIAWKYTGVIREKDGLENGLKKLRDLEKKAITSSNSIKEKIKTEDLGSAVFVIKAILTASLAREESRGAFIRSDFPDIDNINLKKNSSITYNPDEQSFDIEYRLISG